MESENKKNKMIRKGITIGCNLICGLTIVGAFQMIFDKNHSNDYVGGFFLLVFWMFLSLKQMINDMWDGKKQSAIINLLFTIVTMGLLIFGSVQYFFSS
ncbi:hypothetical protein [Guptibacillus hwajinpoensis]|uniref:Uncharacterized BrkB/YihY/UPF0761 family membrane protein n=1 Tax=Guptibacillus hwajinpoensis TaxID=208199 RepID=A0ABU0K6J1_9BACL|nr:hypothetical protein [Alkalihalobacillus hemicentroti]MDQ0483909.1 uncharacterized BrkB/YihY/UPF0761 family membrane protein [Alkalihalobacillus hemicentroti]